MTKEQIRNQALILDNAMRIAKEIERLTASIPNLSIEDAYKIQDEGISLREFRGQLVVGYKMGLTSKAKREQMNLDSPIYGVLTDAMQVLGGRFSMKGSIHPRIEPEIAFRIGRDLKGQPTPAEVLDACSEIFPALEILDSRFLNFKYFSLPDVIADNSSSAYFILGNPVRNFKELDLENLFIEMRVNGKIAQSAYSAAISGNPLNSIVQLCEILNSRGNYVKAGSIVLTGAATQAIPLEPNTVVEVAIDQIGATKVTVTN